MAISFLERFKKNNKTTEKETNKKVVKKVIVATKPTNKKVVKKVIVATKPTNKKVVKKSQGMIKRIENNKNDKKRQDTTQHERGHTQIMPRHITITTKEYEELLSLMPHIILKVC